MTAISIARPCLKFRTRTACFILLALTLSFQSGGTPAFGEDNAFEGWEGMRVIHQPGRPDVLRAGDLFGDGRDELVVVNRRQSRLDIFRWLPEEQRGDAPAFDPQRPNELPMAPEIEVLELPLEELPRDVRFHHNGGSAAADLLVLADTPNRLLHYRLAEDGENGWDRVESWSLLPGRVAGENPLLLRRSADGTVPELFISFEEGVQRLRLESGARAGWFQPRERAARRNWWFADLEGNGGRGVVEWIRQSRRSLRWYGSEGNELLPARTIGDEDYAAVEVLSGADGPDELLLLGGAREGILRRYQLEYDEEGPVGRRQHLALGARGSWTGFLLEGEPALVAASSGQPRMEVFELAGDGWKARADFPAVQGIRAMESPVAEPGLLLIWAEDAADLYRSRWENGRLSYPRPMPQSPEVGDRRIMALGRDGEAVWWAQKVNDHLDVYHWPSGRTEPNRTRFPEIASNIAAVKRLGEDMLLFMELYGRDPKVAVLRDDGTVQVTEPSRLRGARLDAFFHIGIDGEERIGRLADGVWQWLDADLHTEDQIMLPEGLRMAAYLPLGGDEAWVLERGGETLYRMRPDETGIPRAEERYDLPGVSLAGMVEDPHLGLLLYGEDELIRLSPGAPRRLVLAETIDSRMGRPTGVREATIHRLFTADITGDGRKEVLFSDDRRHQLTALKRTETGLESLLSWQVFEDRSYPYGPNEGQRRLAREPRIVVGLDIDGDGRQDLAMLSHDRLVIYLAREPKTGTTTGE